jgi:uncharacterized protein (TIGR02217 family)
MSFNLEEIDTCPAYGWVKGVGSDILLRTKKNYSERRNDDTDLARHTFVLPMVNVEDEEYAERLNSAFLASRTILYPFLAKDYTDYRHGFASNNYAPMRFGVGDGVTTVFQLQKRYTFGSRTWDREITKPVAGALFYVDGVLTAATLDLATGLVTFAGAPTAGKVLTWAGEFRVPVRFAEFEMQASIDNRLADGAYAINCTAKLIEVFHE